MLYAVITIVGGGALELAAVGPKARHHRRIHRIGQAEPAEEIGPALAEAAAAVAPDRGDAVDVGLDLVADSYNFV